MAARRTTLLQVVVAIVLLSIVFNLVSVFYTDNTVSRRRHGKGQRVGEAEDGDRRSRGPSNPANLPLEPKLPTKHRIHVCNNSVPLIASWVHAYTEEGWTPPVALSGVTGWTPLSKDVPAGRMCYVGIESTSRTFVRDQTHNRTQVIEHPAVFVSDLDALAGQVLVESEVMQEAAIRTGDDLTSYVDVVLECNPGCRHVRIRVVTRRSMKPFPPPAPANVSQAQERLLELRNFRTAPPIPFGRQDMGFAVIHTDVLFIFAGFCGGGFGPGDYGCEPRGHATSSEIFNARFPHWGWRAVPPFPGPARQSPSCASLGRSVFCLGGCSYTPINPADFVGKALPKFKANPFAYSDLWQLELPREAWKDVNVTVQRVNSSHWESAHWKHGWTQLSNAPVDLNGAAMIGHRGELLLLGGCDYDMLTFHTWSDANGNTYRLGSRLWKYNVQRDVWSQGPECPGTPRFDHTLSIVDNSLFVMAGVTTTNSVLLSGGDAVIRSAIDNWRFDLIDHTWHRLADHPTGNRLGRGIQNVVYDRYMVFLGGAPRPVIFPDGRAVDMFGVVQTQESGDWRGYHFANEISFYDSHLDRWGKSTVRLPFDSVNLIPMVVDNTVYMLGGENVRSCWREEDVGIHSHTVVMADAEIIRVV